MTFVTAIRFISCCPISVTIVIATLRNFDIACYTQSKAWCTGPCNGRAEVRWNTSVYFGIDCRHCDHRIPLVEAISGPRIYQWFVPHVAPSEVRCEKCGVARTHRFRHVIVLEAPTVEDLDTHPAFRNP